MAPAQSARFLATAGRVIRDCFKGPTILAAAILIVMFMTAYVPFVGAWLGRTVAVLMTLGPRWVMSHLIRLIGGSGGQFDTRFALDQPPA